MEERDEGCTAVRGVLGKTRIGSRTQRRKEPRKAGACAHVHASTRTARGGVRAGNVAKLREEGLPVPAAGAGAGSESFAFEALALELAGAADRLRLLAGALLRRLLVGTAKLHFAEDAFALHFLLQCLQRLIDVVVADDHLHGLSTLLASHIFWVREEN